MSLAPPGSPEVFRTRVLHLCAIFRCSETSCYRTQSRNMRVGGTDQSKHLTGFAVDLVPDSESRRDQVCRAVKALGLWYLDEGDHIHVQGVPPGRSDPWTSSSS